jgi:hypothetical protein
MDKKLTSIFRRVAPALILILTGAIGLPARDLGLAHAIIGFAVPVVELSSGVLTNFPGLFGD